MSKYNVKGMHGLVMAAVAGLLVAVCAGAAEMQDGTKTAVFGMGCFWCAEAVFEAVDGVSEVVSGYAGGDTAEPTYREVCGGRTGHAEVVRVTYDPEKVSYQALLDLFWKAHDPTQVNRQGADVGTQYRSIILTGNDEQAREAEASKRAEGDSGQYDQPIATQIEPLQEFYAAEQYHQDYFRKNPDAAYCRLVIQPKLQKVRKAAP